MRFQKCRTIFRVLLSCLLICTGILHFTATEFMLRLMPPLIPFPLVAIYLSGILEIGFALLLSFPHYRSFTRWGLILLFIAVYPANIYMALHPELFPEYPPAVGWWRLPLQFIFIAWVWWVTKHVSNTRT